MHGEYLCSAVMRLNVIKCNNNVIKINNEDIIMYLLCKIDVKSCKTIDAQSNTKLCFKYYYLQYFTYDILLNCNRFT